MRTAMRAGPRLVLVTVVAAALATSCSSNEPVPADVCRTRPDTVNVVMQPGTGDTVAQEVRSGGGVSVRLLSSQDTILFQPANGLSPSTVSRDDYLFFLAETSGSYTIHEVDAGGRRVATSRLSVESC
jgi:hypothetical protein